MELVPDLPLSVWIVLSLMACAVVSCALGAAGHAVAYERQRHDLAVAAKKRRHNPPSGKKRYAA